MPEFGESHLGGYQFSQTIRLIRIEVQKVHFRSISQILFKSILISIGLKVPSPILIKQNAPKFSYPFKTLLIINAWTKFFLQMANRYLQRTLGFVEKDMPEPNQKLFQVLQPQPLCAFNVSLIEILSKIEALFTILISFHVLRRSKIFGNM